MDLIPFGPQIVIATGIELVGLAIGVGLAIAAGALLTPKKTRNPNTRNNTSPTLAERGVFIPYVLGTARVGAVVAWMGRGKTKSKDEGGFLGFGTTKVKTTTQQAWHILCVGPVHKLIRIYEQGRIIYPFKGEPPLTPESHPSGTKVTLKSKAGAFRIYWGYLDQPGDDLLTASSTKKTNPGIGISSTWPNVCYVVWDSKKLEVANQWPQIDYEVEVRPISNYLFFSDPFMEGTAPDAGPFFINNGVNPAHALMQMMVESYPHGIGIPQSQICGAFMENLGTVMQTEEQPVNLVVQEGEEAIKPIVDILKDVGAILPQCGDKIVPVLIRGVADENIPIFDDDLVNPDQPEREFTFGEKQAERLTFVFKDRNLAFRDGDVTIDNDADQLGRPKSRQIELNTVIDKLIASKVADRRQQEDFASVRGFVLNASRGARILQPGQVIKNARIGQVRVVAIERLSDSPNCKIECVADVYSPNPTTYVPPENEDLDPELEGDPVADVFDWIEAPPPLANNALGIILLRARGSEDVQATLVNLSRDGVTFVNISTIESFFLRGLLNAAVPYEFAAMSADGITITCDTDLLFDSDNFVDLSAETTRWRSGEQVCVIENEICFFRKITPIAADQFRIEGLIRGRLGSLQVDHAINAPVWLGRMEDLIALSNELITRGTVYVQSLPVAGDLILDPDDTSPISHDLQGTSLAPYPPVNFRAEDSVTQIRNTFASGGAVNFAWANRSRFGNGTTAGTQLSGIPISDPPAMDGQLSVTLKTTGGVTKDSFLISSGTTHVYANATLVGAFGGEPTEFDVVFYQIDGSFPSVSQTIRITRR